MQKYLIKNIHVVNEGSIAVRDVLIGERIERIEPQISRVEEGCIEINGEGKYLLPGCIDDQVHFREPGLTHKANIYSEVESGSSWRCYKFYGNAKHAAANVYAGIAGR